MSLGQKAIYHARLYLRHWSSPAFGCTLYSRSTPRQPRRTYASKPKPTSTLIPGSQQVLSSESSRQEYAKAKEKMQVAIEWFRKECATFETRASGRVTTDLLAPVKVTLPRRQGPPVRLEELATVGVRDGSTLLITVFQEDTLKHVESALYDAKIPNVVPHRHDSQTIKISIPKPTIEARAALYTTANRQAEDTRVQIRNIHQASVKRGKYRKHSAEIDEFQKLTDRSIEEIDKILAKLKKSNLK